MSTIRTVYFPVNGVRQRPNFPATDQHPLAVRYDFDHPTLGPLCVDALGAAPVQAEIDAVILPTQDFVAATYADSVDKVQFRLAFNIENRVRALEGKAAVTMAVYRQAVIDLWKQLNP